MLCIVISQYEYDILVITRAYELYCDITGFYYIKDFECPPEKRRKLSLSIILI